MYITNYISMYAFVYLYHLELVNVSGTMDLMDLMLTGRFQLNVGKQNKLKIASRKSTSTVWDSFADKFQTLVTFSLRGEVKRYLNA